MLVQECEPDFSGFNRYLLIQGIIISVVLTFVFYQAHTFGAFGILISMFIAGIINILTYIYLIPSIIAYTVNSPQLKATIFINVAFGWTIIGWIIALLLAIIKPRLVLNINNTYNQYNLQQNLNITKH